MILKRIMRWELKSKVQEKGRYQKDIKQVLRKNESSSALKKEGRDNPRQRKQARTDFLMEPFYALVAKWLSDRHLA